MLRDPNAPQLRAVAPLVALGNPLRLLGPITIVANGPRVIGVTSAELLRVNSETPLAIATRLDGSATVAVKHWNIGRYSGVGLVEFEGGIPTGHDVVPLPIAAVNASVDVHGATAAVVTIEAQAGGFVRSLIPVHVDPDDAGGMADAIVWVTSPLHPAHIDTPVEGGCAFAWLPPEPALGRRTTEVVAFAMAYPYRAGVAKPRDTPVIAELAGLDDLGRALIAEKPDAPGTEVELDTVAGEIGSADDDPLAGL